ncbi:DUF4760 domain-containing protein [Mesorhizobium sp. PUT5]|uniref:DUF4760 domain-containing protein n=1 Tax=Mesorhizobium sp. PUT5 TaxID=3454629 RepID=UPI003FA46753
MVTETVTAISDILRTLFTMLAFSGVVVALLAWRSKQSMDQRKDAIGYSLTKNPDYFKARSAIESKFTAYFDSKTRAPVADVENDPETLRQTKVVLAHWETMAISIFDGILDEKTCFEMVATTLVNTVEVLRDFIDERRRHPLNVRRYDYLLILTDVWKTRLDEKAKTGTISRYEEYVTKGRNISAFKRSLAMDKQDW